MIAKTPTAHNAAKKGDFASTVIMPGDPKRSEYIAKHFLTDARLVNNVRGVQGYTGFYNGKKISVMAHGMGMPSMAIYAHELFNFYGVKKIIRVGSAGAISADVKLRDVVVASPAVTESNIGRAFAGQDAPKEAFPSKKLLKEAKKKAKQMNLNVKEGIVLSSDLLYEEGEDVKNWKQKNALAAEMEAYILYLIAQKFKKEAICLLTISDLIYDETQELTAKERQNSMNEMIKLALEIAE